MNAPAGPRRPRRGFTLVELLVAIALMTILTGSVVFIFIQAQKIFLTVDARVQVYQYARYAFDQMERDLSNVVRTNNMEFFNDLPPPNGQQGHYDPGEEIPIRGTEHGDDTFYNRAFTIRRHDKFDPVDGSADGDGFFRDSLYFKTVTTVGGETSSALIEYALVDEDRPRPRLVKRLWRVTGVDGTNPLRPKHEINGQKGDQAEPDENDLCLYTMECEFSVFVRNRRTTVPGDYFHAEALCNRGDAVFEDRIPFEWFPNDMSDGGFMIQTLYHEGHNRGAPGLPDPDYGVFEWGEEGLFHTKEDFQFAMLREGDSIFISGGGLPQGKPYTIKAFVKPDGTPWEPGDLPEDMRIEFEEPIEWPQAQVGNDLEVRYLASFLPPAIQVTLKIKDAKSREIRSVQRVFKILSST